MNYKSIITLISFCLLPMSYVASANYVYTSLHVEVPKRCGAWKAMLNSQRCQIKSRVNGEGGKAQFNCPVYDYMTVLHPRVTVLTQKCGPTTFSTSGKCNNNNWTTGVRSNCSYNSRVISGQAQLISPRTAATGSKKNLHTYRILVTDNINILGLNQGLTQGQKLTSSNNKWVAILQTDGNFVVYEKGKKNLKPVWATDTSGHKPVFLILQGDGNLVMYKGTGTGDQGGALWNSRTYGHNPVFLIMQDDGNLVMYKGTGPVDQGGAIWNSRSFNWKG